MNISEKSLHHSRKKSLYFQGKTIARQLKVEIFRIWQSENKEFGLLANFQENTALCKDIKHRRLNHVRRLFFYCRQFFHFFKKKT